MSNSNASRHLLGFDNHGSVFESGDVVLRKINRNYSKQAREYFRKYDQAKLHRLGFVETAIVDHHEKDELTLSHEKHRITYPFEWPAGMYKDAVLFYLNLIIALDRYGLTLKDALPSNILFNFSNPVFVDFLSLVSTSSLINEEWLTPSNYKGDARSLVFQKMFLPYMLLPLFAGRRKDFRLMRELLSTRSCNCEKNTFHLKDLFSGKSINIILKAYDLALYFLLHEKIKRTSFSTYVKFLNDVVEESNLTPSRSSYASYYTGKNENFSIDSQNHWLPKQKSIKDIILTYNPKSVLDIGSNTGWYSLLAEKCGASVIATDSDESSIDFLYNYAKSKNLKILPLLLPFRNFSKDIFPNLNVSTLSNRNKDVPLFSKATRRLKSDLVLCLGLIHHLILGQGHTPGMIFSVLAEVTASVLVLEYVCLNDPLIIAHMDFFPKMQLMKPHYGLEDIIAAGKARFREYELLPSNPDTRCILVFRK
jgi:SAM-dependent methyltransferase